MQVQRRSNFEEYRQMLSSVGLQKEHLILPVFVQEKKETGKIDSMPGISITPVEKILDHVQDVASAGISSIIIFGVPEKRDKKGLQAADRNGIVQKTVRDIRSGFGRSMNIITDVCVCQYNLSGHCGLLDGYTVDNDATLRVLSEIASSHAEAGTDVVAPSSMMDGQVSAIRRALDEHGFGTRILSYSAKHASSLYAPFRAAAFSKGSAKIDKSSYQISYANPRQVMREIEIDINEGADMVMVKPALAYLDLVCAIKDRFGFPTAVQTVSGEYAMIKAAAARGWIDEEEWTVCSAASMKRAGADRIISYFSLHLTEYL